MKPNFYLLILISAICAALTPPAQADQLRITAKRGYFFDVGHVVISRHRDDGVVLQTAAMWPKGNLVTNGANDVNIANQHDCGAGCQTRIANVSFKRANYFMDKVARQYGSRKYHNFNWCSIYGASMWESITNGNEILSGDSPNTLAITLRLRGGNNSFFNQGLRW